MSKESLEALGLRIDRHRAYAKRQDQKEKRNIIIFVVCLLTGPVLYNFVPAVIGDVLAWISVIAFLSLFYLVVKNQPGVK